MNERVKAVRKALNLIQPEFAFRLGVTAAAVSKIEKGINPLTEQMRRAICREYGVDPEWLLTGEGEMFGTSDEELQAIVDDLVTGENEKAKALIRRLARFDDEQWEMLEKMVDILESKCNR